MASFSSYIMLTALKLLGIKKDFSQNPIDVNRVRKNDVLTIPKSLQKKYHWAQEKIAQCTVSTFQPKTKQPSNKHILLIHGGAFISGPALHHWNTVDALMKLTNSTVSLIDYPKAPEHNIIAINRSIDSVYEHFVQTAPATSYILLGDSAGATLILTLVQRLVQEQKTLPVHLFPITPVCDASITNPAIQSIVANDPMLHPDGVRSAKTMTAQDLPLKDPQISPLYGSFENFPPATLFLGGRDILQPDGLLVAKKIQAAQVPLTLIDKSDMPHIWPILQPMYEARQALDQIAAIINALD